ncbi:hypothetical protein T492DRAFT_877469 [Pavlovales sp. CCMP2436]|nr:hypothetical protein T492DRAFT_877469 [Pavlovales sp. CCMP2436]
MPPDISPAIALCSSSAIDTSGDSKSPAITLTSSSAIDSGVKVTPANKLFGQSGVKVTPADKLIGHSGVKVTPADKLVGTSGVKVTPADKLVGTWTSLFRRMGDAVGALISTKISGVKMTPVDKLDEATPNSKSTITVLNLQDETLLITKSKGAVLNLQDESAPTIKSKDIVINLSIGDNSQLGRPRSAAAAKPRMARTCSPSAPPSGDPMGDSAQPAEVRQLRIGTAIERSSAIGICGDNGSPAIALSSSAIGICPSLVETATLNRWLTCGRLCPGQASG